MVCAPAQTWWLLDALREDGQTYGSEFCA
jgi:hypothetical protein